MNSILEIENALGKLPEADKWEIARWLLEDLEENARKQRSVEESGQLPQQPDYGARRRRIFGDKVLPNMVLEARAQERW
jgi:hypothetical protein